MEQLDLQDRVSGGLICSNLGLQKLLFAIAPHFYKQFVYTRVSLKSSLWILYSISHSRWWKFSETINSNEPITELYWCWWPGGSYLCSTKRCWFITKTNWIWTFFELPRKIHVHTSTLWWDIEASLWEDSRSLLRVSKSFRFWKAFWCVHWVFYRAILFCVQKAFVHKMKIK